MEKDQRFMDKDVSERARLRQGVVLGEELGAHPGRSAGRHGLERVHAGAYVASTQPVDIAVLLEAVRCARTDREWVVMGEAALWLYDVGDQPDRLVLGVPLGTSSPLSLQ